MLRDRSASVGEEAAAERVRKRRARTCGEALGQVSDVSLVEAREEMRNQLVSMRVWLELWKYQRVTNIRLVVS